MDSQTPIVKRINHIIIRVSEPNTLFSLFTNIFQLPIAWPMTTDGAISSGGVFMGNVKLEILSYSKYGNTPTEQDHKAQFFGIAFEPYALGDSLNELAKRKIPHGFPIPYSGVLLPYKKECFPSNAINQSKNKLWSMSVIGGLLNGSSKPFWLGDKFNGNTLLNIFLGQLLGILSRFRLFSPLVKKSLGKSIFYLIEYDHDVDYVIKFGLDELYARQGGTLGIEYLNEICIGVASYEEKQNQWKNFLMPAKTINTGEWQIGNDLIIRLVPHTSDLIKTLTLKVRSLEKAREFLTDNNMLDSVENNQIIIKPLLVQGLDVRLVE